MLRGAEKVRRAATKAHREAELPRRGVARLARSHPLAGPLLARQAVDLPAAHWAPAVHREATLPAAARLKAVPAADRRVAARPRVVPAADRAVVPPEVVHPVVPPAADRRVRSHKVISAVALRLSLLGSSLNWRQSAYTSREAQGFPAVALHLSMSLQIEQLASVTFKLRGPAQSRVLRQNALTGSLPDVFTFLGA